MKYSSRKNRNKINRQKEIENRIKSLSLDENIINNNEYTLLQNELEKNI